MSKGPLRILVFPKDTQALRFKSVKVPADAIPSLQTFIQKMIDTMYASGGYGLSAIQVGHQLQIFVMDSGAGPAVFINPEVVEELGSEEQMVEGCLSFPGMFTFVKRCSGIKVKYLDRYGIEKVGEFSGTEAQCVQHEMEHFEGKLLGDRVSEDRLNSWASKQK